MKKKIQVIIKFKNRKQRNEVYNIWTRKGVDILALQFGQLLFINNSMCFKTSFTFINAGSLKTLIIFFSFWFFNMVEHGFLAWYKWLWVLQHFSPFEYIVWVNMINYFLIVFAFLNVCILLIQFLLFTSYLKAL